MKPSDLPKSHVDITHAFIDHAAGQHHVGRRQTGGEFSWAMGENYYAAYGGLSVANVTMDDGKRQTILFENTRENHARMESAGVRFNQMASDNLDPDSPKPRVIGGDKADKFQSPQIQAFIDGARARNDASLRQIPLGPPLGQDSPASESRTWAEKVTQQRETSRTQSQTLS